MSSDLAVVDAMFIKPVEAPCQICRSKQKQGCQEIEEEKAVVLGGEIAKIDKNNHSA